MCIRVAKIFLGFVFLSGGFALMTEAAETEDVAAAIQKQVASAGECQELAYAVELKNFDPDRLFSDCVERRAIRIAIMKKYGTEILGHIDIIDKLDAYSYLADSPNALVQQEASRYLTATGGLR